LSSGGSSTTSSGGVGATGATGLPGLAAAGANDPGYQQTYRDCLRRRGF
jgi:hypothetical protein